MTRDSDTVIVVVVVVGQSEPGETGQARNMDMDKRKVSSLSPNLRGKQSMRLRHTANSATYCQQLRLRAARSLTGWLKPSRKA